MPAPSPRFIHSFARQSFARQRGFGYLPGMDADRIADALKRIETAAARIEVAAQASKPAQVPKLAPNPGQEPDPGQEAISKTGSEITEAHARLRAEAGVALAELDALIGSLER